MGQKKDITEKEYRDVTSFTTARYEKKNAVDLENPTVDLESNGVNK